MEQLQTSFIHPIELVQMEQHRQRKSGFALTVIHGELDLQIQLWEQILQAQQIRLAAVALQFDFRRSESTSLEQTTMNMSKFKGQLDST